MRLLDARGNLMTLGRMLHAGGGEGAIFEVEGYPDLVAKVYKPGKAPDAEKLCWIAHGVTDTIAHMAAWPVNLLYERQGGPLVGYLMRKIVGGETLDKLYRPEDRFKLYPSADWGFLIDVAINLAVVFEHIHYAGVVVGDVKQENTLVLKNGRVVLVDCDSFQVRTSDGRVLPCPVHTPEFTPHELQGMADYRSIVRTENHDRFGLAALIFHLLFVGRHPFSGAEVGGRVLETAEAIKQKRFVYSRRNGKPSLPLHIPTLDLVPFPLARLFEDAFAPDLVKTARPTATEWRTALTEFRAKLRQCKVNRLHAYHSVSGSCPWCRFERKHRSVYFRDPSAKALGPKTKSREEHSLLARVLAYVLVYGTGLVIFCWSAWLLLHPELRTRPEDMPRPAVPAPTRFSLFVPVPVPPPAGSAMEGYRPMKLKGEP